MWLGADISGVAWKGLAWVHAVRPRLLELGLGPIDIDVLRELSVYLDYRSDADTEIWPAEETLADAIGWGIRRVATAIRNLISAEVVKRKRVPGKTCAWHNRYEIAAESESHTWVALPETCTTCRPAPRASQDMHHVHPDDAPRAPLTCTTCTFDMHHVHPDDAPRAWDLETVDQETGDQETSTETHTQSHAGGEAKRSESSPTTVKWNGPQGQRRPCQLPTSSPATEVEDLAEVAAAARPPAFATELPGGRLAEHLWTTWFRVPTWRNAAVGSWPHRLQALLSDASLGLRDEEELRGYITWFLAPTGFWVAGRDGKPGPASRKMSADPSEAITWLTAQMRKPAGLPRYRAETAAAQAPAVAPAPTKPEPMLLDGGPAYRKMQLDQLLYQRGHIAHDVEAGKTRCIRELENKDKQIADFRRNYHRELTLAGVIA